MSFVGYLRRGVRSISKGKTSKIEGPPWRSVVCGWRGEPSARLSYWLCLNLLYRGKRGAKRAEALLVHVAGPDGCFSRKKTSPPKRPNGKSPERSGLQLDIFWETALPLGRQQPLKYACLRKPSGDLTNGR